MAAITVDRSFACGSEERRGKERIMNICLNCEASTYISLILYGIIQYVG